MVPLIFYPLRFFPAVPFILMIILGLTLPSDGGHGFLNFKSLAYLGSALALVCYLGIYQTYTLRQLKIFILMLFALCFLLFWLFIGILVGKTSPEYQLDQFKIFWLTISVVGMLLYLIEENIVSITTFFKSVILANCFYSCCKILMVILHVAGIIDLFDFMNATGLRYMSMGIYGGVARMQTSVDIISPFLLLFVFQADYLKIPFSNFFKLSYFFITFLSIFLSFSRFLIFVAIASLLLHLMTQNIIKWMKIGILAVLLSFAILSYIGFEGIESIYSQRTSSKGNIESDQVRILQIEALLHDFYQYPVFGKGIGSYAKEYIRDSLNKHSYEVQWAAFLMQFGLIGITILLLPSMYIFSNFFNAPMNLHKLAFGMLYGLWLLSGFTNPFLISLTSGIVYSLFILAGRRINEPAVP